MILNILLIIIISAIVFYGLKFLNCELDNLSHLPYYGILKGDCKP